MAKKQIKKKADKTTEKKNEIIPAKIVSEPEITVMIRNDMIAGTYSNIALVHHTEREFVMDFIFGIANQTALVSRVITSPQHIKILHKVLGENIKKYEDKFGEIMIPAK